MKPGLFNSLDGENQETQSEKRTGRDPTHITRHVGDTQPIEEGEQETVEDGQDAGRTAFANLTGILSYSSLRKD